MESYLIKKVFTIIAACIFLLLLSSSCSNKIKYKKISRENIKLDSINPEAWVKVVHAVKGNLKCTSDDIVVSVYKVIVKTSGDTVLVITPCDEYSVKVGENRTFYSDEIKSTYFSIPYEIENEYVKPFKAVFGKLLIPND